MSKIAEMVKIILLVTLLINVMGQKAKSQGTEPSLAEGKENLAQKHFKEAVTFFQGLAKTYPDHPEVFFQLGRAYWGLEDFGSAVDCYEKAVTLAEDSARYHLAYGQALFNLTGTGSKLKAFGRAKKGRDEFEKVLQLDPRNEPGRIALFQYYLRAPGIVGGDKEKARKLAQKLQELAPENLTYRLMDIDLLLAEKKFNEVENMLKMNLDQCQTRRDSAAIGNGYNTLGYYHLNKKNCERAIACFKNYMTWIPREANPHDSLGDAYAKCGDLDAAMAEYEMALKIDSRFEKISGKKLYMLKEKRVKMK